MKSNEIPQFAMMGLVSVGKSSIVSTLAMDENVEIGPKAGITKICTDYPCKVDGEEIYVVWDTPGVQHPIEILEKLRNNKEKENPIDVLKSFCDEYKNEDKYGKKYKEDIEFLKPIIKKMLIVYIVDSQAKPKKSTLSKREKELEILKMCGSDRILVINKRDGSNNHKTWREELKKQFDGTIKYFDPYKATFEETVDLILDMGRYKDEWKVTIKKVLSDLKDNRKQKIHNSAIIIKDYLKDMLTLEKVKKTEDMSSIKKIKKDLLKKYLKELEESEVKLYNKLKSEWEHNKVKITIKQESWYKKLQQKSIESIDNYKVLEPSFSLFGLLHIVIIALINKIKKLFISIFGKKVVVSQQDLEDSFKNDLLKRALYAAIEIASTPYAFHSLRNNQGKIEIDDQKIKLEDFFTEEEIKKIGFLHRTINNENSQREYRDMIKKALNDKLA